MYVKSEPTNNLETALNRFYVKNGTTYVRGGGYEPDYPDVTLDDFARRIAEANNLGLTAETDEELNMEMFELLFECEESPQGILASLYNAAWAFAELRERLSKYEALGYEPEQLERLLKVIHDGAKKKKK